MWVVKRGWEERELGERKGKKRTEGRRSGHSTGAEGDKVHTSEDSRRASSSGPYS